MTKSRPNTHMSHELTSAGQKRAEGGNGKNSAADCSFSRRRQPPGKRGKVGLVIPAGESDDAALMNIARDWLVPLLVNEFLRERDMEPTSPKKANKRDQTSYEMPLRGTRDTTRGLN